MWGQDSVLTLLAHCRWAAPQDGRQMQRPGWVQCMQSVGQKEKGMTFLLVCKHMLNKLVFLI